MNKLSETFKRVFRRFDTTLIYPPKEQTGNRNFKGQVIKKKENKAQGPIPNVE